MPVSMRSAARAKAKEYGAACYVGVRQTAAGGYPGKCYVFYADGEGGISPLDPRNDLWDHSPDGFEWGYGGSGPTQLALGVLAHHLDPNEGERAIALRMAFKFSIVNRLPEAFVLPVEAVEVWFECVQAGGTGNHARLRATWLQQLETRGIDPAMMLPSWRR